MVRERVPSGASAYHLLPSRTVAYFAGVLGIVKSQGLGQPRICRSFNYYSCCSLFVIAVVNCDQPAQGIGAGT